MAPVRRSDGRSAWKGRTRSTKPCCSAKSLLALLDRRLQPAATADDSLIRDDCHNLM